jgi:carbamate kinase
LQKHPTIVISLGGNALVRDGRLDFASQLKSASKALKDIPQILSKWNVVITHGNGPQVGASLIRHQAAKTVPPYPLYACVAETQGSIGYLIEAALEEHLQKIGLRHEAVTVITRALVDRKSLAKSPRKPIGPYYTKEELQSARKLRPAEFRFFRGKGYRLLVPSPEPKEILEADLVRDIAGNNCIIIACGGGGIPVAEIGGRLTGMEVVIDKDFASGLLATAVGADVFVSLTDVEGAYINFESKKRTLLRDVSLEEIRRYYKMGEFAEGSMGPKVLACIRYLGKGGKKAVIAHLDKLKSAVDGRSGTQINR